MKAYFYDNDKRYVGCCELLPGEQVPSNATTTPVMLASGQQAHLIDGEWVISDIPPLPESPPGPPTLEERISSVEAQQTVHYNSLGAILEDVIPQILSMIM